MRSLIGKSLLVSLASSFCIAAVSVEAAETGSDAATPTVYLYRDELGIVSTFDVQEAVQDGITTRSIVPRSVSADEIGRLEREGFKVGFLDGAVLAEATGVQSHASKRPGSSTESVTTVSSIPANFNIIERSGVIYGNIFALYTIPSGSVTQWDGYTFNSTAPYPDGGHFVNLLLMDPASLSSSPSGLGTAIGTIGTGGGCNGNGYPSYDAQLENAWTTGNQLYANTCYPSGIANGTSYNVVIQASLQSWLNYTIKNITTGVTWGPPGSSAPYCDSPPRPTAQYITPSNAKGGILFAAVFPGANDWTLTFTNFATGFY